MNFSHDDQLIFLMISFKIIIPPTHFIKISKYFFEPFGMGGSFAARRHQPMS